MVFKSKKKKKKKRKTSGKKEGNEYETIVSVFEKLREERARGARRERTIERPPRHP